MIPYEYSFHVCLHVLQLIYSSHLLLIIADQSNVKKLKTIVESIFQQWQDPTDARSRVVVPTC